MEKSVARSEVIPTWPLDHSKRNDPLLICCLFLNLVSQARTELQPFFATDWGGGGVKKFSDFTKKGKKMGK